MGCASGKKVSRCSAAKDVTSELPIQDSMEKPTTPVPQEQPEGISLAPVAALLAKGGEEQRKPVKPALPPPKKPLIDGRELPKPLGEVEKLLGESGVQMRKGSDGENAVKARKGSEDGEKSMHKRKNSSEVTAGKRTEDPQKMPISPSEPMLPIAKNISGVKTTFDKGKFKQVNASGPATLEEQLEEIPLFTGSVEKPLSTLTLPTKQKPTEGTGSTVVSNL